MSTSKKGKGGGQGAEVMDLKKDQTLTAVVIADSFDTRFRPLTEDLPRCLLPVANRPVVGYTLDFLKNSGVQEVFVYCSSHPQQIKSYLSDARWTEGGGRGGMAVSVISNEECRSFGDAMRDLDGKGLIRGDFVLVSGDTVANVDLRPVLEEHKARVSLDRNSTMTLVYKKAAPGHHCRTLHDELVVATDGRSGRLLHHHRAGADRRVAFPLEVFQEAASVELRHDLLDPCVSVCSQSVPPLFADHFDFETLDDFVQGILTDELVENTIYVAALTEGYAARVSSLHNYLAVTGDVLSRWLHPLVPDACGVGYRLNRHNVYKGKDIQLMHGSLLERDVILGHSSSVGEKAVLSSCSVGRRCKVGANVSVCDSVVMDGVTIGAGSQIRGAVIGEGVVLGEDVVVPPKCVLGRGVAVPRGTALAEDTRLVSKPRSDGFSDDEEEEKAAKVGEYGPKAFRYLDSDEEEEDDDEETAEGQRRRKSERGVSSAARKLWGLTLAEDREARAEDEDEEDSSSDSDLSELGVEDATAGDIIDDEEAKSTIFQNEVLESLQRGVKQKLSPDNLIVEINSSRHAYAESWSSVVRSVTKSLLHVALHSEEEGTRREPKLLLREVRAVLTQFSQMLRNYCKSPSTELDCLYAVEEFASANRADFAAIAKNTLHLFYDMDILSEEAILKWHAAPPAADEEDENADGGLFASEIRKSVKPLIDWLLEAEDDDDSDDDEDDSD